MGIKSKAGRRFRASLGLSVILLIAGLVFSGDAQAVTIYVDDDATCPGSGTVGDPYCLIQDAITAAVSGVDDVQVADGTYTENITFATKVITIQSENGAASTTIDGSGSGSVVIINADGTLDGFTVTNGSALIGGGVLCADSTSPIIRNCVIDSNEATGEGGGGIGIGDSASPTIQSCTISNNTAVNASPPVYIKGGGIHCGDSSSPTIKNCKFISNSANRGGAIAANTASPTITNCTFNGNTATDVGGAISAISSSVTILNSIFWENLEGGSPGGELRGNSYTVTYSDVQGGHTGTGNINSNPQFVDTTDYHLKNTSPCRNTGDPTASYNDKDGSRNDMGADGGPDGVEDTKDPTITTASADPMSGSAPLGVAFTGAATDDWGIASYSWDFGDGDTSSEASPNHTYDNCGSLSGYSATLTVTDHSGRSASATVSPIMVGGDLPAAVASATPIAGIASLTSIAFAGSASGGSGSYTWLWTFGDSSGSTDEDPAYIYTTPGAYTPTLSVTDSSGCWDASDTVDVTIVSSDCSDIRASKKVGTGGDTVTVSGGPLDETAVLIPAGVLSIDTVIAISEITSPPAFPSTGILHDITRIGDAVDFAPDGASFSSNVTITLTYENSDVPGWLDENDIRIYFYDTSVSPDRWREEITNKVIDTTDNKVSVDVDHFTFFALAGGVPTPPGGLTATAGSDSIINLSWTINSSDETGFSVERSENSGATYGEIGTVGAGISVYEDNGLDSNTEYWYQVMAENTYGYSAYSNETSATTQDIITGVEWVAKEVNAIKEGDAADITADIARSGDYVYVTGAQWNTTNDNYDYVVLKYAINPNVDLPDLKDPEWTATYNGPANDDDMAIAIAVVDSGVYSGVYVTGKSKNASGDYDYVTRKYSLGVTLPATTPTLLWSKIFSGGTNGAGDDIPVDIAVDSSGNVYVTGTSYQSETIRVGTFHQGQADEAPATYVAAGDDYATVKYNSSSGVQQWGGEPKIYDGLTPYLCGGEGYYCNNNGRDYPTALVVVDSSISSSTGVYVTGLSVGDTDTEGDYLTIKYGLDGTQLWASPPRYDNSSRMDEPQGIAVDEDTGDVYVTGKSTNSGNNLDYATVKYNFSGVQQWGGAAKTYAGTATGDSKDDEARAIGIDDDGNVYVTGLAMENNEIGTTGTYKDSENYVSIRYDSDGTEGWASPAKHDGAYGGSDRACALAVDATGLYVTGTSGNSYVNIKYLLADGSKVWDVAYSASAYDVPMAIAIDSSGHAYIVGISQTKSTAGDDLVTVKDAPDTDGDGMPNDWELDNGLDPLDADDADDDPDGDGLTNLQEYEEEIDPQNPDTDGDGMDDDWELDNGLDPLDADDAADDADNDGYSNLTEYNNGTNPQQASVIYYVDADVEETGDGTQGQPYKTIEEALDAAAADAADDTTINVAAGTYFPKEDLVVPEEVKLIGERWYVCTIDLGGARRIQLVGSYSTLRGFNIAYPPPGRHVIEAVAASSVTITNNVIRGNPYAQELIAAIFLDNSSGRVENNTIDGGHTGIRTKAANVTIVNNIVVNNAFGRWETDSSSLTVEYNFWDNTNSPSSVDPLFVDDAGGNYHLQRVPAISPCIDTGSEAAEYNDKDGSRNDMGVDGGPKGTAPDTTVPAVAASASPMDGNAPLDVAFTGTASDEWGIASWSWNFDASSGPQVDSTAQNPSYTYDYCGGYIAELSVTDHSGNLASTTIESISVDKPTSAAASASPIAAATSTSISFTGFAAGPSKTYTWSWTFGDSNSGSGQYPNHSYDTPGSYTVTLTVTDDFGCQTPTTVPVTIVDGTYNPIILDDQLVTSTGAILTGTGGSVDGIAVEIPPGALSKNTVIAICELDDTLIPSFPKGIGGVGVPVDFGPDGAQFSSNVTITIPYTYQDLLNAGGGITPIDPSELKVYYYDTDTSTWVEILVTDVDTDAKLIYAQTNHFTTYTLAAGAPTPPSGLTAAAMSDSRIDLSWTDNSSDEDGFSIERKTGAGGTYTEIDTAPADTGIGGSISYSDDTGLSASTEYWYRVLAVKGGEYSGYSNETSATTHATSSKGVGGSGGGGGGGGCFIATAAYGTPMARQVRILSLFRDEYLLSNTLGRCFVAFYYKYSPPIAEYIAQKESLRKLARIALWPFVAFGLFMLKLGLVEKLGLIALLLISGYLLPRYVHKLVKQPS